MTIDLKEEIKEENNPKNEADLEDDGDNSDINERDEEGNELGSGEVVDEARLKEMVEVGIFYGKAKAKTHPRMRPFILTVRNGVEILDLVQTTAKLDEVAEFISEKALGSGNILLVGTQPAAKEEVQKIADRHSWPLVVNKWVGGTLTNWSVIRKRVDYYLKLESDKESGRLSRYTKKEQAKINRELDRMRYLFAGISGMNRLPAAMLVVNPKMHKTAVLEAKRAGVPVVAIISTDSDPTSVDYIIPANDNAGPSLAYILNFLSEKVKNKKAEGVIKSEPKNTDS